MSFLMSYEHHLKNYPLHIQKNTHTLHTQWIKELLCQKGGGGGGAVLPTPSLQKMQKALIKLFLWD